MLALAWSTPPMTLICAFRSVGFVLNLLTVFVLCAAHQKRAGDLGCVPLPKSDFSSPKWRLMRATTVPPRVFLGNITSFMPLGSLARMTRASMFCGVGSKASPCCDGCAAFVVLEDDGGIRGCGDFGAIGRGGGDEFAHRCG